MYITLHKSGTEAARRPRPIAGTRSSDRTIRSVAVPANVTPYGSTAMCSFAGSSEPNDRQTATHEAVRLGTFSFKARSFSCPPYYYSRAGALGQVARTRLRADLRLPEEIREAEAAQDLAAEGEAAGAPRRDHVAVDRSERVAEHERERDQRVEGDIGGHESTDLGAGLDDLGDVRGA